MLNEERRNVRIRVIDSNAGAIVRSEEILSGESLSRIACRFAAKDTTVIASVYNSFYCYYINGDDFLCSAINDIEIISFFEEVLSGVYDYARDAYHIQYGRVIGLLQSRHNSKHTVLLACIDNIWNTRHYRIAYRQ
jgi:hypothetical protein